MQNVKQIKGENFEPLIQVRRTANIQNNSLKSIIISPQKHEHSHLIQ